MPPPRSIPGTPTWVDRAPTTDRPVPSRNSNASLHRRPEPIERVFLSAERASVSRFVLDIKTPVELMLWELVIGMWPPPRIANWLPSDAICLTAKERCLALPGAKMQDGSSQDWAAQGTIMQHVSLRCMDILGQMQLTTGLFDICIISRNESNICIFFLQDIAYTQMVGWLRTARSRRRKDGLYHKIEKSFHVGEVSGRL